MKLLDQLNAVPGSANSVLYGEVAALPRLAFAHSRKAGFTAIPSPLRFAPGRSALVAFADWANLTGRYQLTPASGDKRAVAEFECRVVLAGVEVRVWVPIHGMTIQAAITLVDAAREQAKRG